MTQEFVIDIARQAIQAALMLSLPLLLSGMAVGLTVSVFQAATQIQEQTLTFVPKIITVLVVLLFLAPWLLNVMLSFATGLLSGIAAL